MNRYLRPAALLVLGCSLVWGSSWLTYGGDQQRDGWAKDETLINKDNVNGLELGWKIQLDNEAKELNSLTTPLILDGIVTSHGFKEYVFVAGSSDNLYAIDAERGQTRLAEALYIQCASSQGAAAKLALPERIERYTRYFQGLHEYRRVCHLH